ncbi:MAG: hypothetical protein M1812_006551 [Candelaria pacifica]|nr:MAG: hypothetical protein M1812_006551 [Candelaria pacifica]
MEPVSLAFAVAGVADICLKYGKILAGKYQSYRNAEKEVDELVLILNSNWLKIEYQIEILRKIWDSLGWRLQQHQAETLQVLQSKLQDAIIKVDSIKSSPDAGNVDKVKSRDTVHVDTIRASLSSGLGLKDSNRMKYAAYLKNTIQRTIDELEKWQRIFDPGWYLITRLSTFAVDQELANHHVSDNKAISIVRGLRNAHQSRSDPPEVKSSIFVSGNYLSSERLPIEYSSACVSRDPQRQANVIVDTITYGSSLSLTSATEGVRDLARVLSETDPATFGLLTCRGVVKEGNAEEQLIMFDLIFDIPTGLDRPRSLRSLLNESKGRPHHLNERFQLAKSLAKSVMFIHTSSFVHKNIHPETILLFEEANAVLGVPFLVGFENFRSATGHSYLIGDSLWHKNLYRHPKRQGLHPEEEYIMQHDIYSLGVCLLEIGLWSPFVFYYKGASKPEVGSVLGLSHELFEMKDQRKKAFEIKRILVALAKDHLPCVMGKRYTEVVLSCLTCLDKDNENFGDESEFEDDDGILVGVRYIEKVNRVLFNLMTLYGC